MRRSTAARSPRSCCARRSIRCCASASSTPTRTRATSSCSTTARSASSTSARSAGSIRSSRRRSSTCSLALVRRDVGLLRDGIERVADVAEAASPERAGARAGAAHGRPRAADRAVEPTVFQDLVATLARVRHPAARPTSSCCRARWSPSTARCGSSRPTVARSSAAHGDGRRRRTAPVVDRDEMIRDELLAVLPHLRRLPDRIDRILTLTGRGDLRIRSVVDEDSRRIVRTLANRALLRRDRRRLFLLVSAMLLVATDTGPPVAEGTGLFEMLRLRRPARRHGAAPAGRRGGRPGRDDMSLITARRRRPTAHDRPGARPSSTPAPPGERYFRHPGDVVRLVVWGASPRSSCCSSRSATATSDGRHRPTSASAAARSPRRARVSSCWRSPRSSPSSSRPSVVVRSSLRRRWRRLGLLVVGARGRCGALCSLLDQLLDLPGRLPRRRRPAARGSPRPGSRRSPYVGRRRGRGDGRQAVALASWRRAADLALVAARRRDGGRRQRRRAGARCSAAGAGVTVGAAVLVAFGAPNRRPTPRPWSPRPSAQRPARRRA